MAEPRKFGLAAGTDFARVVLGAPPCPIAGCFLSAKPCLMQCSTLQNFLTHTDLRHKTRVQSR